MWKIRRDFETFNAFAADLLILIVSLGQENAWAPSTSRSPLGKIGWWLRWFAKAVGWIVTALLAGVLTGVIRHEKGRRMLRIYGAQGGLDHNKRHPLARCEQRPRPRRRPDVR